MHYLRDRGDIMANRKKRRIIPKIGFVPNPTKDILVSGKRPSYPELKTVPLKKKGKSYKPAGLATFHAGERAIANAENKKKRTGHSRSGRGGGYVDLGPQSGWRKGRRKYGIRIEPKL